MAVGFIRLAGCVCWRCRRPASGDNDLPTTAHPRHIRRSSGDRGRMCARWADLICAVLGTLACCGMGDHRLAGITGTAIRLSTCRAVAQRCVSQDLHCQNDRRDRGNPNRPRGSPSGDSVRFLANIWHGGRPRQQATSHRDDHGSARCRRPVAGPADGGAMAARPTAARLDDDRSRPGLAAADAAEPSSVRVSASSSQEISMVRRRCPFDRSAIGTAGGRQEALGSSR